MASQSGIASWHGQSPDWPIAISVVIPHDLAVALLATGTKAVASDNTMARIVRCSAIKLSAFDSFRIALDRSNFK